MSCLDVMYHQSYGAHYLPAAAYKATYYNHHHHHQQQQHHQQHQQQQQQQQRRLSVYSKMQECMEQQQQQQAAVGRGMLLRDQALRQGPAAQSGRRSTSDPELKDGPQPAETEYLGSRCVLFTYFHGDISDVVDEHFSRALSQSSTFGSESKPLKVTQVSAPTSAGLWKDGPSLSDAQSSSAWSSSYAAQASSCLGSVPVHPDFTSSPVSFNHPDGALWADHVLSQGNLPPPGSIPDTWTYGLNPQNSSGYPNVYHTHPHIHSRHHHHPMLHSYPAHSAAALDHRFSPLLLPATVRNQSQQSASAGSSPLSEGVKSEADASNVTAASAAWSPSPLQGSVEVYDTALDHQTKAKTSVWF